MNRSPLRFQGPGLRRMWGSWDQRGTGFRDPRVPCIPSSINLGPKVPRQGLLYKAN